MTALSRDSIESVAPSSHIDRPHSLAEIDRAAIEPADKHVDGQPHAHARIPGLDGLRGIALLAVLFLHLGYATTDHEHGAFGPLFRLIHLGWVGVDFFFVISGFLITGILLDTKTKPKYFRDFYARRTLRIFPLYYGVLLLTVLVAPLLGLLPHASAQGSLWTYTYNIAMTFRSMGMVPANQGEGLHINFIHFWSLAVEEQFYLVWPLVIYLVSKRSLKWIALAGLVVAITSRVALGHLLGPDNFEDAQFFTFARLDGLCCGALIALGVRSVGDVRRAVQMSIVGLGAVLLALVGAVAAKKTLHFSFDPALIMQSLKFTLVAATFGMLLALTLHSGDRGWLSRSIGNPLFRFFGKYSYGLYVYHMLLLPQFIKWFGPEKIAPGGNIIAGDLLFIALAAVVSTALAVISFHIYEAPILSLKRYFSYR